MPRGKVTRVPDGDTIKIKKGPWLRLDGVDAPEKWQFGFDEAKDALKEMVVGKTVNYKEVATDAYGRPVAKVKVGNKSVNAAMKRKGYK